jgi:hypothetical protein
MPLSDDDRNAANDLGQALLQTIIDSGIQDANIIIGIALQLSTNLALQCGGLDPTKHEELFDSIHTDLEDVLDKHIKALPRSR